MPPLRKPWNERILSLAQEPVPYDRVVAEAMAVVHPGQAYRKGLEIFERYHGPDLSEAKTRVPLTHDEVVRTGARAIVVQAMARMNKREQLRYIDDSGKRLVVRGSAPVHVYKGTKRSPGNPKGRPLSRPYAIYLRQRLFEVESIDRTQLIEETMAQVPDEEAERGAQQIRDSYRAAHPERVVRQYRNPDAVWQKNVTAHRRRLATNALSQMVRLGQAAVEDGVVTRTTRLTE